MTVKNAISICLVQFLVLSIYLATVKVVFKRDKENFYDESTTTATKSRHSKSCSITSFSTLRDKVEEDPRLVAESLDSVSSSYEARKHLAKRLLKSWTETEEALLWVDATFSGLDRGEYFSVILKRHAAISPTEALAYWRGISGSERVREDALVGLAHGWFHSDKEGLLAYVESEANSREKEVIFNTISFPWVHSHLPDAIKYIESSDAEALPSNFVRMASAIQAKRTNPEAVLKWAESLDNKSSFQAKDAVISSWARKNPEEVGSFLESLKPHEKSDLGESLIHEWAKTDPEGVLEWVKSQNPDTGKSDLVKTVVNTLVNADPISVSEWLVTLPEGPSRDEGIFVLVEMEGKNDPESMYNWAQKIESVSLRKKALDNLWRNAEFSLD